MSTPAVRLERCAKTFADGTRALEPIELSIAQGETLVLLGPSGCGKTTTLRLIAGLEVPDPGGRVWFGGDEVTQLPIERRRVGMVFQSYALFPNMTVAENIGYGLKIRRIARAERQRRVDELLAMMHIEALRDRRIDQLSGGQRQRVALARALAPEPRILLLDEPLTALDAKLRDALRTEIDGLLRRLGITAVYVTHDQAEAMALGDRIVVMEQGRVAQIGRPRDIYFQPASRFVADFIGSMNRLAGSIVGDRLVLPGGTLPWRRGGSGTVEALCRPEHLRLAPDGPLAGTIASVFFLGDRTRLVLDGVAAAPVMVDTAERREFARGAAVRLDLDPDNLLILED